MFSYADFKAGVLQRGVERRSTLTLKSVLNHLHYNSLNAKNGQWFLLKNQLEWGEGYAYIT